MKLGPLAFIKKQYIPLLAIYFAYGCSFFSGIGESFFVKEHLNLSATALVSLGIWLTVPWTVKIVFGQIIDNVFLFRSNRKVYIFISSALMALSSVMMASLAGGWYISSFLDKNTMYVISSLVGVIAIVIQDVTADAMSIDVVDRDSLTEDQIKTEMTRVQLLSKLFLTIGVFSTAGLAGWIADAVSYQTLFLLTLFIPCISITGCLFTKIKKTASNGFNRKIIVGGLLYCSAVLITGLIGFSGSQEVVFVVSLIILSFLIKSYFKQLDQKAIKNIVSLMILVFIFRAMPSAGPGAQWFMIDVLGFSKSFFGTLGQIGSGMSILGMFIFAKHIESKSITFVFFWISVVTYLLSLPMIGMYYGLHEWTQSNLGFGAHAIALIDTAAVSQFDGLMMIPVLAAFARYAPKGNSATWFALMASMMNLALNAGSLLTKYLNMAFVVERGSYDNLGYILVISSLIGIIIPMTALFFYKIYQKKLD